MLQEIVIFGREIPAYSFWGLIGIAAGMIAVILRSKKLEISTDDSIYIFVFGLIGALVGAKILYLLLSVEQIVTDISAGYNLNVLFANL